MAISVDWATKLITVNQTDPEVSFVSGTTYELDTDAFRLATKALEAGVQGMAWPRITKHNTVVVIDGVEYVRSWELINGYTVQCLPDTSWRLRMDGGSNNNFHSEGILVQNAVQVLPANSAGNIQTGTSGLTTVEADYLETMVAIALGAKTTRTSDGLLRVTWNGRIWEGAIFEDEDGTTAYGDNSLRLDRQDELVEQ